MSEPEDEIARAKRFSETWKAREAEIDQARREDAELAARDRASRERYDREHGDIGGARLNFTILAAGILIGLVVFERIEISDNAQTCLSAPTHPHEYGCATIILNSPWSWLLPSDTKTQLRASAALSR
jgi:hypothetical protein